MSDSSLVEQESDVMDDVALAMWAAVPRLPAASAVGRDLDKWAAKLADAADRRRDSDAERWPLTELAVSSRVYGLLAHRARLRTIGDLTRRSQVDLLDIRQFGRGALAEVHEALDELGLSLEEC